MLNYTEASFGIRIFTIVARACLSVRVNRLSARKPFCNCAQSIVTSLPWSVHNYKTIRQLKNKFLTNEMSADFIGISYMLHYISRLYQSFLHQSLLYAVDYKPGPFFYPTHRSSTYASDIFNFGYHWRLTTRPELSIQNFSVYAFTIISTWTSRFLSSWHVWRLYCDNPGHRRVFIQSTAPTSVAIKLQFTLFNPLRAKFFRGNINIY